MALRSKAIILSLVLVVLATAADAGRGFRVRKNVQGHIVDVTFSKNPPVLGNNEITIQIRDAADRTVHAQAVIVHYYMPPIPGMAPMNYTVKALEKGDSYRATMNFIMTGPWIIVIRGTIPGRTLRVDIPIDVR